MARKRKKTSTKRRSRRGRVGAIPKGSIMNSVGVIAGAVAGKLVATKTLPNVDDKIKNAGVVALGILLPTFMKNELGKSIGTGMVAVGGLGLVGSFLPAISGTDDMIEFPIQVGEIDDNISVIAGEDDVMAGDDDVMAGDFSLMAGDDEDYDY
jgi:hypothetical protein